METSRRAIETIRTAIKECTCGWKNPEALTVIRTATAEIRDEMGDHEYVREKLTSLSGWVDKLYSPRKHAGWGTERVRMFAFSDCYRLEMYVERFTIRRI